VSSVEKRTRWTGEKIASIGISPMTWSVPFEASLAICSLAGR